MEGCDSRGCCAPSAGRALPPPSHRSWCACGCRSCPSPSTTAACTWFRVSSTLTGPTPHIRHICVRPSLWTAPRPSLRCLPTQPPPMRLTHLLTHRGLVHVVSCGGGRCWMLAVALTRSLPTSPSPWQVRFPLGALRPLPAAAGDICCWAGCTAHPPLSLLSHPHCML